MSDTAVFSQVKCGIMERPRGAGNTDRGLTHLSDTSGRGLGVSLPTSYTGKAAHGAASELIASAHLLAQGYHVFRSVAPTSPVDLVAYRDGELLKVEVKSANDSDIRYTPGLNRPTNDHWDLLVLILSSSNTAITLRPRETDAELRADFLDALRPLGLVRSSCGRTFNGGRRYRRNETGTASAHLIDAARPYATTACGLNATAWLGESDATERAFVATLPLCKNCARYVEKAS